MKIDDIYKDWDKDNTIDITNLAEESIKIPKLHSKWYQQYTIEKMILRRYESNMKLLKKAKYEFYSQGPSKEQIDAGWELPAKGLILKNDIPMYMEADTQIIELSLKIGAQQEKVEFLEAIVKGLQSTSGFSSRATIIKNSIEFMKWTQGN